MKQSICEFCGRIKDFEREQCECCDKGFVTGHCVCGNTACALRRTTG
jgi:hypothetical protein